MKERGTFKIPGWKIFIERQGRVKWKVTQVAWSARGLLPEARQLGAGYRRSGIHLSPTRYREASAVTHLRGRHVLTSGDPLGSGLYTLDRSCFVNGSFYEL